ncbi:MAG: SDR family oxidoreductase [Bacteroidales bacterium]|nr:SDR family oxidoreductase [Bacteroidales bacterium]
MTDKKVAIVTGASQGIGLEIALDLLRTGYYVVLASRNPEYAELNLKGYTSYSLIKTNVEDQDSVKLMVNQVVERYGKIDVLINNAGYVEPKSIFETSLEDWNKTLAVNLTGAFLMTKEVVRFMKKTGGKIVNIASTAGLTARPGWSAYAASKAGLINFSETMAEELREYNIKVFIVAPGRTATDLRRKLAPNEDPRTIMQTSKVAGIVSFLLTDQSDVIEGQVIQVRERK